ncbi:MAG: msrB [Candidatus Eremiobacteraeota bacterium]|nr:msrB [Candidatus Eremiobacteraeota bacterium]
MTRGRLLAGLAALTALLAPVAASAAAQVTHSDAEWRKLLPPEAYDVLRHEGTEYAFSSVLDHEKRAGSYACRGCDLPLFSSKTKYDSGTGWPSFWAPLPNAVATKTDVKMIVPRTEVHCRRCEGHLGHVFDDGPKPTGLRYCMNGVALRFKPGVMIS